MHCQLLEACHPGPYPGAAEAALLLHEDNEETQFIKFIKFTALEEREFVKFSDIPEWRSKTEVSLTHSSRLKLVAGILEAKREKKLLRQSLWKLEEGY